MEDYTYNLEKGSEYTLGAHMLEVCPSVAAGKRKIEVHPSGIGGKEAPARLVFEGREGDAVAVTLVDIGGTLQNDCSGYKVRLSRFMRCRIACCQSNVEAHARPHYRSKAMDNGRRSPSQRA
jgi:hypothetical protein